MEHQHTPKFFSTSLKILSIILLLFIVIDMYFWVYDIILLDKKINLADNRMQVFSFSPKHPRSKKEEKYYIIVELTENEQLKGRFYDDTLPKSEKPKKPFYDFIKAKNIETTVFQGNQEIEVHDTYRSIEAYEIELGEFYAKPWEKYSIHFKVNNPIKDNPPQVNLRIRLNDISLKGLIVYHELTILAALPFLLIMLCIVIFKLIRVLMNISWRKIFKCKFSSFIMKKK